ncbi:MAG: tyrosine--tRNA ligase [Proteobacteria bacterium]|nr:tyrosine--tRNA ligase [Pseudomonadota bacterium]
MTQFQSLFLNVLSERGFLHQCTDEKALDASLLAKDKPMAAYIGFDCTAPSLHVGSLLQIMTLRWLQKTMHKPIVLMGGGTTKVGDPSGRDESRQLLSDDGIKQNMEGIKKVFSKYIQFEDKFDPNTTKAFMVNNADWLDGLNYISFLRDYGSHFSVNRMLTMDSVKLRLEREQPLSFLEFNYMILQAYDYFKLATEYGIRLQIGGSDQWGNIVSGIELHRRVSVSKTVPEFFDLQHKVKSIDEVEAWHIKQNSDLENKRLFGLTTPLITTSGGKKMGKTADGAVWLNADKTSPYDYWQFWRNTDDADVGRFLRLFTELPVEEIARLEKLPGAQINDAKIVLANEATKLCHGEAAAKEAHETAQKTFEQGGIGDALPTFEIPSAELAAGIEAFTLFLKAGLTASGGEARKLIQGGGGKINGEKIESEKQKISSADLKDGVIKLSAGKKKHILVKAV